MNNAKCVEIKINGILRFSRTTLARSLRACPVCPVFSAHLLSPATCPAALRLRTLQIIDTYIFFNKCVYGGSVAHFNTRGPNTRCEQGRARERAGPTSVVIYDRCGKVPPTNISVTYLGARSSAYRRFTRDG